MEPGVFQIIRAGVSTCIASVLVKGSSAHGMIPRGCGACLGVYWILGTLGVITGSPVVKVKELNCLEDHPARRTFLFPGP